MAKSADNHATTWTWQDTGCHGIVDYCQHSDTPHHSTLCEHIEEKVLLQGELVNALKLCCLSGH